MSFDSKEWKRRAADEGVHLHASQELLIDALEASNAPDADKVRLAADIYDINKQLLLAKETDEWNRRLEDSRENNTYALASVLWILVIVIFLLILVQILPRPLGTPQNIATLTNSFGLVFDIAGALILFRYGLPEAIDRKGNDYLILGSTNEEEKKKAKNYDRWSQAGAISLVLGFLLQLLSNFI